MPIKDSSGDVIGVAQVINKLNGECFTELDEKVSECKVQCLEYINKFEVHILTYISRCLLFFFAFYLFIDTG